MMTETPETPGEEAARYQVDALNLAQALHAIVTETDDAEAIRIAMSALLGTRAGRDYLDANPLRR